MSIGRRGGDVGDRDLVGGGATDRQARSQPVPGKQTIARSLEDAPAMPVQHKADGAMAAPDDAHEIAATGVSGHGQPIPHGATIQQLFGRHDISDVKAHIGGSAAGAAAQLGANAYAMGNQVGFRSAPDLHTAAHEAAHTVQQRGGVQLAGGVGQTGDVYERNADHVADAVVAGRSAESLLDPFGGSGRASSTAVQRDAELDEATQKQCLQKAEAALKQLEGTVAKQDQPQPDYIKDAVKLLRTMMNAGKIKFYAFSGMAHGKFKSGEIQLDGANPDMINTTTLLHEGVHALHGQQAPKAAKAYADNIGKEISETDPKLPDMLRWKAYTEYWAYRARFDYYNPAKPQDQKMPEADIHKTVLSDSGVKGPMAQVWKFDPKFDPRVWKPKG
jgi:hypothetical protein